MYNLQPNSDKRNSGKERDSFIHSFLISCPINIESLWSENASYVQMSLLFIFLLSEFDCIFIWKELLFHWKVMIFENIFLGMKRRVQGNLRWFGFTSIGVIKQNWSNNTAMSYCHWNTTFLSQYQYQLYYTVVPLLSPCFTFHAFPWKSGRITAFKDAFYPSSSQIWLLAKILSCFHKLAHDQWWSFQPVVHPLV